MRSEVKVAMVVVLIVVVVCAIYFFSGSEKTIEVKPVGPLTPPVASTTDNGPVAVEPRKPVVEKPEEKIDLFPTGAGEATVKKDERGPRAEKPVWTINLEPLSETPTTGPVRSATEKRADKIAAMESAANKVIPNQPISLDTPAVSLKPEVKILSESEAPTVSPRTVATTHVVKEGETLYQIAKAYYGRGYMWETIARANPSIKPEKIRAGDKLIIPEASQKTAVVNASKSQPTGSSRTYKVRYGDTLELIAQEQLGDSSRWKEILKLNRDKLKGDARNLKADSSIRLPEK